MIILFSIGVSICLALIVYFTLTILGETPEGPAGLIAGMIGNLFPYIYDYFRSRLHLDKTLKSVMIGRYFLVWPAALCAIVCAAAGLYSAVYMIVMISVFGSLSSDTTQLPQPTVEFIGFGASLTLAALYGIVAWWFARHVRERAWAVVASFMLMAVCLEVFGQSIFFLPRQHLILFGEPLDENFQEVAESVFYVGMAAAAIILPGYFAGRRTREIAFLNFIKRNVTTETRYAINQIIMEETQRIAAPLPSLPVVPRWPALPWWIAAAVVGLSISFGSFHSILDVAHRKKLAIIIIGAYILIFSAVLLMIRPSGWIVVPPKRAVEHPMYGGRPLLLFSIIALLLTLIFAFEMYVNYFPHRLWTTAIPAILAFATAICTSIYRKPAAIAFLSFGMCFWIVFILIVLLLMINTPLATLANILKMVATLLALVALLIYVRASRHINITILHRVRPSDQLLINIEDNNQSRLNDWLIARQLAFLPMAIQSSIIDLALYEAQKSRDLKAAQKRTGDK